MPKLPSASGKKIIKSLNKMGFIVVRQKGSHVFIQRGEATVTVPLNNPVKKIHSKEYIESSRYFSRRID